MIECYIQIEQLMKSSLPKALVDRLVQQHTTLARLLSPDLRLIILQKVFHFIRFVFDNFLKLKTFFLIRLNNNNNNKPSQKVKQETQTHQKKKKKS